VYLKPAGDFEVLFQDSRATVQPQMCDAIYSSRGTRKHALQFMRWIHNLMLWLYMLVITVLMVNLLVAMMSDTYSRIKEHSYQMWKLQQYELIQSWRWMGSVPPPFSIAIRVYQLLYHLWDEYVLTFLQGRGWLLHSKDVEAFAVGGHTQMTSPYTKRGGQGGGQAKHKQLQAFTKECQLGYLEAQAKERQAQVEVVALSNQTQLSEIVAFQEALKADSKGCNNPVAGLPTQPQVQETLEALVEQQEQLQKKQQSLEQKVDSIYVTMGELVSLIKAQQA